jgi:hypothetical protein
VEEFDRKFFRGRQPAFDEAPVWARRRLFGVNYLHLRGAQGGDLFLTRSGWSMAEQLEPHQWFTGEQFARRGRALAGATGAVYRVPVTHPVRDEQSIVVKFSRFGQDVGVTAHGLPHWLAEQHHDLLDHAEFLPPFEEFGNVRRLRADLPWWIGLMRPLAIYSPPTRYLDWQLGRKRHLRWLFEKQLARTQGPQAVEKSGAMPEYARKPVSYDWERQYILLYSWLTGPDLEEVEQKGRLAPEESEAWTRHAHDVLQQHGWVVLDHKPRHVVVRRRFLQGLHPSATNSPPWGLVDYELLQPINPSEAGAFSI